MQSREGNILILLLLLIMFFGVWYITGLSPKQRNRKVSMFTRYVRKDHELHVRIESIGKLPVEIMAPEIRFYNKDTSRAFAIKSQGQDTFPLSLYPLTDYQFKVNLYKFYYHDVSLKDYRKAKLIVREKTGRLLSSKRIWI
jgi:hypothetical protein